MTEPQGTESELNSVEPGHHDDEPVVTSQHLDEADVDGAPPAASSGGTSPRAKFSPGALFFGALVSLGFLGFVLLARVTVHPFDKVDRRMRVLDVWSRLRNHLPDVAHPTLLKVIFDVSIILVVVGSLACVWLALLAASAKPDDSQESDRERPKAIVEPPVLQSEH